MNELLETEAEIKAVLLLMNPIAREASKALSTKLLELDDLETAMRDKEWCFQQMRSACVYALSMSGFQTDEVTVDEFMSEQLETIGVVGFSIAIFLKKKQKLKEAWGIAGTIVAGIVGLGLGIFFG